MPLPPGFLDELRSRSSIARIIGRKVTWDGRKTNGAKGDYWAPCPFHHEKTASFHVDDAKGYYYCFGCHAKGDAITFLRESENMGFMEAVEVLAQEAGMTVPAADPGAAEASRARQGLSEAMEAAVQFYRLQLSTARAADARAYLDRRGLSVETRDRFEIGCAPDGRTALLEALTGKGFALETLQEAGLVGLPEGGGRPYDRFRNRIMFPIRDIRGRAIAFGARALAAEQQPKYLNSPETPLFDKGRSLYNAKSARAAAGRAAPLVVTEGYMDVIALAQAGFEAAVAPLGTAITEDQLAAIWRLSPEPVVALDGDRAGQNAAERLINLALPLLAPDKGLRFALMPPDQDPDDVIQAGGPGAMAAILENSQPLVELLWRRETEDRSFDSPERRAGLETRLKGHLERISDPGLRSHYRAELRRRRDALFGAGRSASTAPADGPRPGKVRRGAGFRPPGPSARPASATLSSLLGRGGAGSDAEARIRECAILALCLAHPSLTEAREDRLEKLEITCPDLARMRDAILSALAEDAADLAAAVKSRLGRDPMPMLTAPGQVRTLAALAPGTDPALAARALDEAMARHAALLDWRSEVDEAARDLAEATIPPDGREGSGATWRLAEAARARDQADRTALSASEEADRSAEEAASAELQALIDAEAWKRPRRH